MACSQYYYRFCAIGFAGSRSVACSQYYYHFCSNGFSSSRSVACSQYYYHIPCHWIYCVRISGVQSILLSLLFQWIFFVKFSGVQSILLSHSVPLDLLGQDQWRVVNITRKTNSKEQSPYCEGNRSSASQEILRILWPEGSLPHSQVPAVCPYPKPEKSSSCPPFNCLKINFNIIIPHTRKPSK